MDKEKVLAFATDLGGKTSHVSIIAQNLDIPALVGMQDISTKIKGDELAIIDGNQGVLIIDPSEDEVKEYQMKIEKENEERQRLEKVKNLEAKTLDGKVCEIPVTPPEAILCCTRKKYIPKAINIEFKIILIALIILPPIALISL